jgi:hypothetical protein
MGFRRNTFIHIMERFFDFIGQLIFLFIVLGGLSRFLKILNKGRQQQTSVSQSMQKTGGEPSFSGATPEVSEIIGAPELPPIQPQKISVFAKSPPKRIRRAPSRKAHPTSLLAFDPQRGYLQGIILSEILGPPVSKRRSRNLGKFS